MTDKHTLVEAISNLIALARPHFSDEAQMLALEQARAAIPRITALEAEKAELVERLCWYADTFCEQGPYSEVCGRLSSDECSGCLARATLAKHQEGEGK